MSLPGHRNRSLPRESGAEDARTLNAAASSADSTVSAKRLECVRFIGAFRPARDGQRFMDPMHGRKAAEALHELPRSDKFRAVQFLTAELALGDDGLLPGGEYPIWSPYEAHDA